MKKLLTFLALVVCITSTAQRYTADEFYARRTIKSPGFYSYGAVGSFSEYNMYIKDSTRQAVMGVATTVSRDARALFFSVADGYTYSDYALNGIGMRMEFRTGFNSPVRMVIWRNGNVGMGSSMTDVSSDLLRLRYKLTVIGTTYFSDTVRMPGIIRQLLDTTNFKLMVTDASGNLYKTDWRPGEIIVGTTTINNGTPGQILFQGPAGKLRQSSGLAWDSTLQTLTAYQAYFGALSGTRPVSLGTTGMVIRGAGVSVQYLEGAKITAYQQPLNVFKNYMFYDATGGIPEQGIVITNDTLSGNVYPFPDSVSQYIPLHIKFRGHAGWETSKFQVWGDGHIMTAAVPHGATSSDKILQWNATTGNFEYRTAAEVGTGGGGGSGTIDAGNQYQIPYYSATGSGIVLSPMTALTGSRLVITDAQGRIIHSAVTATQAGYLSTTTSDIQTQINGKAASSHTHSAATDLTGNVPVGNGGTNIASYTAGDMLYASGTTTLAKLAAGASNTTLLSGTTPSWGKLPLSTHTTGVLAIANGGTNKSSWTTNAVVYVASGTALGEVMSATDDSTRVLIQKSVAGVRQPPIFQVAAEVVITNPLEFDHLTLNDQGQVVNTRPDFTTQHAKMLQDLGSAVLEENFPSNMITTSSALADGHIRLIPIRIRKEMIVSGIVVIIKNAAVGVTGDQENRAALFSFSGGVMTLVGQSSSSSTLWSAAPVGQYKIPFTGNVTLTPDTYYLQLLYNQSAGTPPALAAGPSFPDVSYVTQDFANGALLSGDKASTNVLTTPVNVNTWSAITSNYYAGVYISN